MRYQSTRDQTPPLDFEHAMLDALARDGGLFVPEAWPRLDADTLRGFPARHYADIAAEVLQPFVSPAVAPADLQRIVCDAYSRFRHEAVAPLRELGPNLWLMELYHGPTLAFKDVAMQVLGGLFEHLLQRRQQTLTIIGATSGDTGSAAIEAIRGRANARIVILHPHNRTSAVQRRQMTTVHADNVHNVAIHGTFDDCQNLVKAMFNDAAFREEQSLSGVNSINWARVMPQIIYYLTAATALGAPDRGVRFTVPTGNFGNVYAGYAARQMGLSVDRLVVASNSNDILTRTLNTGDHSLHETLPTHSPSMDIQISSNFERLLFDLHDRDGAAVRDHMAALRTHRRFDLPPAQRARAAELFSAHRTDEDRTLATLRDVHERTGALIDPHTAVGVAAAQEFANKNHGGRHDLPMVVLGTAHPAKFPDAVEQATGIRPPLPPALADLFEREERYTELGNDLEAVKNHIRGLPA